MIHESEKLHSIKRKGVCYDVGRVMMGQNWRPVFDPAVVHRELEIIQNDLHCNAVRICGQDLDRLMIAAEDALDQGLEVWLSPELWDKSPDETLAYIANAARRAEVLRLQRPDRVVFSVGSESTLFMQAGKDRPGIVEGNNVLERLGNPSFWETVRSGAHNPPLNAFLTKANDAVRQQFKGKVTYASVPLETVDWSPFDFVCTDLYRDARTRENFAGLLRRFFAFDRPVVVTEFGCCTYHGASDAGGMGWAIIDYNKMPTQLNGEYVRDEAEQAQELTDVLGIFADEGVAGTFVMTFVDQSFPNRDDPRYDLDMASYSLVKSYAHGKHGTTYPDMPWEPKESFKAVGDYYAGG
jgi:hypothetical protein